MSRHPLLLFMMSCCSFLSFTCNLPSALSSRPHLLSSLVSPLLPYFFHSSSLSLSFFLPLFDNFSTSVLFFVLFCSLFWHVFSVSPILMFLSFLASILLLYPLSPTVSIRFWHLFCFYPLFSYCLCPFLHISYFCYCFYPLLAPTLHLPYFFARSSLFWHLFRICPISSLVPPFSGTSSPSVTYFAPGQVPLQPTSN